MPFVPDDPSVTRGATGQPPVSAPTALDGDLLGAAFRQYNTVGSALQMLRNSGDFTPDPNHNPLDTIKGSKYEQQHLDRFLGSQSEPETKSIMRQIDQEDNDRSLLASSGGAGFIAGLVAGTFDPTIALIPGSIAIDVGKAGMVARGAIRAGAGGFAQSVAQETVLHATQETKTPGESVLNVATGTLLAGLIGEGAFHLLGPEERAVAVNSLNKDRQEMAAHAQGAPTVVRENESEIALMKDGEKIGHINYEPDEKNKFLHVRESKIYGEENRGQGHGLAMYEELLRIAGEKGFEVLGDTIRSDAAERVYAALEKRGYKVERQAEGNFVAVAPKEVPVAPASTGLAAEAGAAATDTRKLDLVPFGLDKVPGIATVTEKMSPMQRNFRAESLELRRATADLAETPLLMKQNLEGVPTTQGPALDREASMLIHQKMVGYGDEIAKQFADYRGVSKMRAIGQDLIGQGEGKLTISEFKEEVSRALVNGDQHAVPQVQAAAQYIRKIFDETKDRAVKAGLLAADVSGKPDDSYLQRIWNKRAIAAQRPELLDKVTGYYKREQEKKAASKDRMGLYAGALEIHNDTIKKLEARIETKAAALREAEAKAEETSRLNKEAFKRSGQLREAITTSMTDQEKAAQGRGGAFMETKIRDRGNVLGDQESARAAEHEELHRQLDEAIRQRDAMRAKIEEELGNWDGKSATEAKAALERRAELEAERQAKAKAEGKTSPSERLRSADKEVKKALKRILKSDRDLSEQELRSRADETIDRLLGSVDGRLPYDMEAGHPEIGPPTGGEPPRGPLANREFQIPTNEVWDFVEHDIERIVQTHLRTLVPDVLLTEKFGDTRMSEAFRKINDEYAAKAAAAGSEKERAALEKERQGGIRDLAAIRDRIRGTFGYSSDAPTRQAARVAGVVKNFNVISLMGMAAISSLPDAAGAVFRYGMMNVFQEGFRPFLANLISRSPDSVWSKARAQYRAMGIVTESLIAARHHGLSDIADQFGHGTRLERSMQWGANKFQFVNGLAPWTDWAKTVASTVSGSEILKASKAAREGGATKKQVMNLAENGIDAAMATRIHKAFEGAGEVQDGVHLPNTQDWKDLGAKRAFEGAVSREANIAVVTPGQEKALWMSSPVLSALGQFKSFSAASTERVLIANLQRRDAQTLQGLIFSMGLGMISYKINSMLGGQATSDKPQDWIKESISRGNLLGWFEDGNALASKATRGGVDIYRLMGAEHPMSRFASRSVLDQLLGPTAGKIENLFAVTGAAAKGDWKQSDTTALRRLQAFQNVFWLRNLFNEVEHGANNALGIPEKQAK